MNGECESCWREKEERLLFLLEVLLLYYSEVIGTTLFQKQGDCNQEGIVVGVAHLLTGSSPSSA